MDNLRAGVLRGTDTLVKEGASIDLKRKKLTIQDVTADIVFKTPDSLTGMHITTRPTMHEILRQRRLDYAAFTSQFRAKSPVRTPTSDLQAKSYPETAPLNRQHKAASNIPPHLTVADLYTRFHRDSIPIWRKPTTPPPYSTSLNARLASAFRLPYLVDVPPLYGYRAIPAMTSLPPLRRPTCTSPSRRFESTGHTRLFGHGVGGIAFSFVRGTCQAHGLTPRRRLSHLDFAKIECQIPL